MTPSREVPNYLVQSILVTLFCCLPFGVVAIVFAAQVNSKLEAGDYEGAVEASNKAKLFCWISFGISVVAIVLYILAAIVIGVIGGVSN